MEHSVPPVVPLPGRSRRGTQSTSLISINEELTRVEDLWSSTKRDSTKILSLFVTSPITTWRLSIRDHLRRGTKRQPTLVLRSSTLPLVGFPFPCLCTPGIRLHPYRVRDRVLFQRPPFHGAFVDTGPRYRLPPPGTSCPRGWTRLEIKGSKRLTRLWYSRVSPLHPVVRPLPTFASPRPPLHSQVPWRTRAISLSLKGPSCILVFTQVPDPINKPVSIIWSLLHKPVLRSALGPRTTSGVPGASAVSEVVGPPTVSRDRSVTVVGLGLVQKPWRHLPKEVTDTHLSKP